MKSISLLSQDSQSQYSNNSTTLVKVYALSEYITWVEFTLKPEEEINIKLNDQNNRYLHFIYNFDQNITISCQGTKNREQLDKFQSAIVHEPQGKQTYLHLKPNRSYEFYIAQVSKYNADKEINDFFPHFEETIHELNINHYFIHTGLPNLELGEYVKKIIDGSKDALSDRLMASGYINILLSIKLKQFINFILHPPQASQLSRSELERVQEVSETIIKAPEDSYSIDNICKVWGLNANKLQLGFREMHNRTVCSFINHQRLLKAEKLLKSTDMNVSQIVYSLGWSSRSYFCKIFKEKFQCSPKSYKVQLMSL